MATIRVRVRASTRHVTVRGELSAADLRRLEVACGPALEQQRVHLEVRVRDVEVMDETSRLFLDGLVRRGAILT